ncbi:MAG: glycosyltransferase family 2 protein [Beijerinckiaceae bacterium]|jgi:glycosyltransferase involved in cell wall biosynthesis|nr:glycosyltransferase family 2 protein [Beijerinckiaceae bacterium]
MSAPSVSVLIPCYNAAKFIGETLDSVLSQTWAVTQIVVVDDGSTDESIAEVERIKDSRVQLIRQANRGQTAALNVCLQASTGDYVQYLDADDLLAPGKIDAQMRRLVEHPSAVATCEWSRFVTSPDEASFTPDLTWRDHAPLDWLHADRSGRGSMMFPAMWLIPATVAKAAGPWNEELTLNNDAEYFTRVVLAASSVLFCPGARVYYRSGVSGSLSGLKSLGGWKSQFNVLDLCEKSVLAAEDSERMRLAFAQSWQDLAHACYPYTAEISGDALSRARALHPLTRRPSGGPTFQFVASVIGWRAARKLQVWTGRT